MLPSTSTFPIRVCNRAGRILLVFNRPTFFAHSTKDATQSDWHRLDTHLKATAALARARGEKFGVGAAAELAGLLHDLGKYTPAFQKRLIDGPSVDHATAGAKAVRALAVTLSDKRLAELLEHAIAGHHGGLPDRAGDGGLSDRLSKAIDACDPCWREEIAPNGADLFPSHAWHRDDRKALAFQFAFLGRMIFSCLVDADYRDTEAFYAAVEGRAVDRDWPTLIGVIDELRAAFDDYMARKPTDRTSAVNILRAEILAHVRAQAAHRTGLFTLTVPTGGGKTLASLGFALDHARAHGLDRIIYAIPFTSVIDQTADVFRRVLGDSVVLEHHSALEEDAVRGREGADKLKLAMEDWAAPLIVTTNVQLFESLFSNRPSRCRKLHNLARSVIVLDEAQTIPLHVLRPCMAALDALARDYGCSILLCTATQPALLAPKFKKTEGGFEGVRELAPRPAELAAALKRVTIRLAGPMTDGALLSSLSATSQGLVILNSRAHALALYRSAVEAGLEGMTHLSTRQHATDRRSLLEGVRQRLRAPDASCRVIATSLIEAGVDVDFPVVWRAEAGLDQIAQAAGRCNREGRGRAEDSIVTVFEPIGFAPPTELKGFIADMARIKDKHADLLSLAAIEDYFDEVYWRKGAALDRDRLMEMFRIDDADEGTAFAYRTVAETFRMIESGMTPVIVATDAASRAALEELEKPQVSAGAVVRRLQSYIVQIPPRERARLIHAGDVRFVAQERLGDRFAVLQNETLYSRDCGLVWEEEADRRWEGVI